MKTKERYLDRTRGVAILFVMAVHLLGVLVTEQNRQVLNLTVRIMEGMTVPLFFAVSGILFGKTGAEKKTLPRMVGKYFSGVMVPYFCFSLIYFIRDVGRILLGIAEGYRVNLLQDLVQILTLRGMSVLWFLPALFLAEIEAQIIIRKGGRKLWAVVSISGVLVVILLSPMLRFSDQVPVTFLYVEKCIAATILHSMSGLFYLWVGYELEKMQVVGRECSGWFSLFLGVFALGGSSIISSHADTVDYNLLVFGSGWMLPIQGILGVLGVLLVCYSFSRLGGDRVFLFRDGRKGLIESMGVYSLYLMLTHLDFMILGNALQIASFLNRYITRARDLLLYLNTLWIAALTEVLVIILLERYGSILLGSKGKR